MTKKCVFDKKLFLIKNYFFLTKIWISDKKLFFLTKIVFLTFSQKVGSLKKSCRSKKLHFLHINPPSSLTPNSESNSIPTTQPKIEPGNPISGISGNDSFSSLSESTSALNNTNLNLQSTSSGLPTTGLPTPGMSSFHWSSYSTNYEKVKYTMSNSN